MTDIREVYPVVVKFLYFCYYLRVKKCSTNVKAKDKFESNHKYPIGEIGSRFNKIQNWHIGKVLYCIFSNHAFLLTYLIFLCEIRQITTLEDIFLINVFDILM